MLSLVLISLHHGLELLMPSPMLLLLLLLVLGPFLPFLIEASPLPGLSKPPLIIEDRPIIQVLQVGETRNHSLPVVRDLLAEWVVLHVQHGQVGHFSQDFGQDLSAADLVVADVQR